MDATQIILAFCGTAGASAFITSFLTKSKTAAQAEYLIGKTYQEVLENLRREIDRLEKRIDMQQQREVEYLKIIGQHKEVEAELRRKIFELESQMFKLQTANNTEMNT